MRTIVQLQCEACKNRNYSTTRNKAVQTDKLKIKKFCRHCRKHTDHKESK